MVQNFKLRHQKQGADGPTDEEAPTYIYVLNNLQTMARRTVLIARFLRMHRNIGQGEQAISTQDHQQGIDSLNSRPELQASELFRTSPNNQPLRCPWQQPSVEAVRHSSKLMVQL